MYVSHKSISKCSCCFWLLRSPQILPLWNTVLNILSNQKLVSRNVSCEWADLFWSIISLLVDFISILGSEIETKTSSFKNAGVGPFLIQEARWSDTYFSKTILTLSIWGGTVLYFWSILVSIFTLSSRFSFCKVELWTLWLTILF